MTVDPDDVDELEVLAAVAQWARPFLRGDAPPFGSADWLALDLDDPRRAAAVVRAALAWWRVGEPLEDVERRARDAMDVESSHAVAGALRSRDLTYRPTRAELDHRRRLPQDRPEDFPGGRVESWGAVA